MRYRDFEIEINIPEEIPSNEEIECPRCFAMIKLSDNFCCNICGTRVVFVFKNNNLK
jgi:hypothetical protein